MLASLSTNKIISKNQIFGKSGSTNPSNEDVCPRVRGWDITHSVCVCVEGWEEDHFFKVWRLIRCCENWSSYPQTDESAPLKWPEKGEVKGPAPKVPRTPPRSVSIKKPSCGTRMLISLPLLTAITGSYKQQPHLLLPLHTPPTFHH